MGVSLRLVLLLASAALPPTCGVTIVAPAVPGGLLAAQMRARRLIATRPVADVHIVLRAGVHRLDEAVVFGPADSGEPGRFKVVWSGETTSTGASLDGGVSIPGPWTKEEEEEELGSTSSTSLWSAPLPSSLTAKVIRQLYSSGTRLARTRTAASAVGFPAGTRKVGWGFETASDAPSWRQPSSVELVSDHTWVQHRCPVAAVTSLPTAAGERPPAWACWYGTQYHTCMAHGRFERTIGQNLALYANYVPNRPRGSLLRDPNRSLRIEQGLQ